MHKFSYPIAFILGLIAVAWTGAGFVGTSPIALGMTALIAIVFTAGALEVRRFRAATEGLDRALAGLSEPVQDLEAWIGQMPEGMRPALRQRLAGERAALPGLAMAPYLVGLLVMLGMLGTFLGMVMTFQGAVFALEGSTDLQAIRSALAAPIRGLGFSFGTSVAGVATSALLGLMVAWARRERQRSARRLDAGIAGALRPFSAAHRRQAVFDALQQQSQVLPEVGRQLQTLIERIDQRSEQLDQGLLARQAAFQQEVGEHVKGLLQSVERALGDSLGGATRAAGEALRPVIESAMQTLVRDGERLHAQVGQAVQSQLEGVTRHWGEVAHQVTAQWNEAQSRHEHALTAWTEETRRSLQGVTQHVDDAAGRWLDATRVVVDEVHARQQQEAEAAQQAWGAALGRVAAELREQWQQAGADLRTGQQTLLQQLAAATAEVADNGSRQLGQALAEVAKLVERSDSLLQARAESETRWRDENARRMDEMAAQWQAQQQTLLQQLGAATAEVAENGSRQLGQALAEVSRLVAQSDTLLQARAESEVQWREAHARRMDELAAQWQAQMQALREEEAGRGQAAVDRLAQLESAVATHLSALGQSLEAPLGRLLETASEAPRAAAEVIARLRQEMGALTERDNAALEERARLMAQLDVLLQGVNDATAAQRGAVEQLVQSAAQVFEQVGRQFADTVGAQAGRAESLSGRMDTAVADLAALGEALQQAMAGFGQANTQLADGLQRVEQALAESMARSDEQLAYYVAQAREVIDLSITAQQGVLEDLRQLRQKPVQRLEEGTSS